MPRRLTLAAAALLLAGATAAAAQDRPPAAGPMHGPAAGPMMHACPMMDMMEHGPRAALERREQLGLSAEQAQRLEALHQRVHEAHMRAMPQMQAVHAELSALAEAERFDEAAARAAIQRGTQLHAEMMLAMLRAQHEARAVLTPEQRERLQQLSTPMRPAGQGHSHH